MGHNQSIRDGVKACIKLLYIPTLFILPTRLDSVDIHVFHGFRIDNPKSQQVRASIRLKVSQMSI